MEWWQVLLIGVTWALTMAGIWAVTYIFILRHRARMQDQRIASVCRELRELLSDWLKDDGKPLLRE